MLKPYWKPGWMVASSLPHPLWRGVHFAVLFKKNDYWEEWWLRNESFVNQSFQTNFERMGLVYCAFACFDWNCLVFFFIVGYLTISLLTGETLLLGSNQMYGVFGNGSDHFVGCAPMLAVQSVPFLYHPHGKNCSLSLSLSLLLSLLKPESPLNHTLI